MTSVNRKDDQLWDVLTILITFLFVSTFIFPQRKNLGTGEKHKSWSKSSIWFKKRKKSVFRLILEGNLLAQLQKVDEDLMYLLLFLKVYARFVLDHYWSGMGICPIFFLFHMKWFLMSLSSEFLDPSTKWRLRQCWSILVTPKLNCFIYLKGTHQIFWYKLFEGILGLFLPLGTSLSIYSCFSLHFAFKWWCY